MFYIVLTEDKPGCQALRDRHRADHYAYLIEHKQLLLASGGLQTDDGNGFTGGLIILDVTSRAEAEQFAAQDPFAKAGLFAFVRIERWKKAFFDFESAA